MRVLVFCAHSDDQAIGAGGYIAKLAKAKAEIKTIVCSFGEQSHPHLKPEEIKKIRVLESQRADRILGGKGVMFLGLHEGNFIKEFERRGLHASLIRQIKEFSPDVILTHAPDDPHPDHRAVHKMLLRVHADAVPDAEVFTFDVWTPFSLSKRRTPRLVVDITKEFKRKLDSIAAFKSQRTAILMLLWSVYTKAFYWGFRADTRYAEVYYKVR